MQDQETSFEKGGHCEELATKQAPPGDGSRVRSSKGLATLRSSVAPLAMTPYSKEVSCFCTKRHIREGPAVLPR
jgi:hypothetical protein